MNVIDTEFLSFVAGILDVPPASLSLATAYESIPQWDSVMHLRLVMEIEEKYGVSFPLEEIPNLKTLGNFYRAVRLKEQA